MAVDGGVDLVVGAQRDATFGPIVLVGIGGTLVEILDDAVIARAPVDEGHLATRLRELRGFALLEGVRGEPPVDLAAVCLVAARLGDVLVATTGLAEVEINPLRAYARGVIALDARLVPTSQDG